MERPRNILPAPLCQPFAVLRGTALYVCTRTRSYKVLLLSGQCAPRFTGCDSAMPPFLKNGHLHSITQQKDHGKGKGKRPEYRYVVERNPC